MSLPTISEKPSPLEQPVTSEQHPLHYSFIVTNLERAIDFYTHVLNARVLRHEEYDSDCPATCNGKPSAQASTNWSKTIVGLTNERAFCFELIYNYSTAASTAPAGTPHTPSSSPAASPFRYVTINIPGAASRAKTAGWRIDTVKDSEGNALAVVCGPDGMMFRCIENAISPRAGGEGSPSSTTSGGWGSSSGGGVPDSVLSVTLRVSDLDASVAYYTRVLGMSVLRGVERTSEGWRPGDYLQVGYSDHETRIELVHAGSAIEHTDADTSRLALSTTAVPAMHERAQAAAASGSGAVLHEPKTLQTPGKADVDVVVLTDPDGHELAFVDAAGWLKLSAEDEAGAQIDWKARERRNAAATPHSASRSLASSAAAAGNREENHEMDELKQPGIVLDVSEYEEGGDQGVTDEMLDRGRDGESMAVERQQQQQQTAGKVEEAVDKTWTSSPHPKPQSPSESRLNMS